MGVIFPGMFENFQQKKKQLVFPTTTKNTLKKCKYFALILDEEEKLSCFSPATPNCQGIP